MQRRPLLVGGLVLLVGAALILFWIMRGADTVDGAGSSTVQTTSTAAASPTATAEPPSGEVPDSSGHVLRIPGIDLEADLHAEGLRGGKVNPPAGTVMWYTGHDRVEPGAVGTAVIAGHVIAGGREDRFANLAEVQVGDQVELTAPDGSTSTFTVVRAEVVDKDDLTTDQTVWGTNDSVRRLAIITCDDAYGFRDDGHRVANYVVIAEPAT